MITQTPAAPAFDPATDAFNPFLPGVMDDQALLARVGDISITRWERAPSVIIWGPRLVEVEFTAGP